MDRQQCIDDYARYDRLLPQAEANVRRLQARLARRVTDQVMSGQPLAPQFGHAERTAIMLAQQEITETRDCLACLALFLIGTEWTPKPHVHEAYQARRDWLSARPGEVYTVQAWLCRNPHCTVTKEDRS